MNSARELIQSVGRNSSVLQLANVYITLYFQGSFDELKYMLHDAIVYDTPSSRCICSDEKKSTLVTGREAVIAHFKQQFDDVETPSCSVNDMFIHNDSCYANVLFEYKTAGKTVLGKQNPEQRFKIQLPVNVILNIKNGYVLHHIDYFDWTVIYQQICKQQTAVNWNEDSW